MTRNQLIRLTHIDCRAGRAASRRGGVFLFQSALHASVPASTVDDQAPTGQCSTDTSRIGKSLMLAVASAAPTSAAAAAIRQSAWCRVIPRCAKSRRHAPALRPCAMPSGATRSPFSRRRAASSSSGCSPRHISSTETAQTHGSTPMRRKRATRTPAGRPRSASINTVESSSKRAMVSRCDDHHHDVVAVPIRRDHRPSRGRGQESHPKPTRCRPSVVHRQGRGGSSRR